MGTKRTITNTLPPIPESALGLRLKIDRADKHIRELHHQIGIFHAKPAHIITSKHDSGTGEEVLYLARIEKVPPCISVIAGDAMQNLRSALDHLVYRLYGLHHPGEPIPKIYFPIKSGVKEYESSTVRAEIESLFGEDARKVFDLVKPYHGGNDSVCRLNRLNNIDKHRLLLSAVSGIKWRTALASDHARMARLHPKANPTIWEIVRWTSAGLPIEPLKVGDELYRGPILSPEEKKKMEFHIDVSFNEPEIGETGFLLSSVYQFSRAVDVVCRRFAHLL